MTKIPTLFNSKARDRKIDTGLSAPSAMPSPSEGHTIMTDDIKSQRVKSILFAQSPAEERIRHLLEMRAHARALQRAVTEGGMTAPDPVDADLHDIELALQTLGVDPETYHSGGPASL